MIRSVKPADAKAITSIYNYYIRETAITFEEIPLSITEMEKRIAAVSAAFPYLVWEEDGEVLGYAYVHRYHERSAYRFTLEDTIYLKNGCEGRGAGKVLFAALLDAAKKREAHVIMSLITVPNDRSVALHEKFGFVKRGEFEEVGFKLGKWLNVGYWELKF
jgi:phosphinothricin acetyltransferase